MEILGQLYYCMCARMYITVFCGAEYLQFCTHICLNKVRNQTKSVSGAITYYRRPPAPPKRAAPACKRLRSGVTSGPRYPQPRAQETGATGPGYLPQRWAAGRERRHYLGNLPRPLQHASPSGTWTPKGQCRVPTPADPRPQRVSSGPGPPAPRGGGEGRVKT